ncbi:hypothetical protein F5Y10DRAFT_273557 [Nemania abortiva]|nr:hypothetical protein F5Y10DRAFT_273557 [Nemania abortiva]
MESYPFAKNEGIPLISERVIDIDEIAPSTTTLQRYLSVKSVLSTASSNAIKQQWAAEEEQFQPLEEIGKGFCGVVLNIRGAGRVLKRAMGVKAHQLQDDFKGHLKAFETQSSWNQSSCRRPSGSSKPPSVKLGSLIDEIVPLSSLAAKQKPRIVAIEGKRNEVADAISLDPESKERVLSKELLLRTPVSRNLPLREPLSTTGGFAPWSRQFSLM